MPAEKVTISAADRKVLVILTTSPFAFSVVSRFAEAESTSCLVVPAASIKPVRGHLVSLTRGRIVSFRGDDLSSARKIVCQCAQEANPLFVPDGTAVFGMGWENVVQGALELRDLHQISVVCGIPNFAGPEPLFPVNAPDFTVVEPYQRP